MEHRRGEEESTEAHKNFALSDSDPPPRDVSIRGGGKSREILPPVCSSLGAMRPLVAKLSMLLLGDAPQECSFERVKDRIRLLKDDIEKISSYLDDLSEVENPPPTAICWMNEARDMSYDMDDYIGSLLFARPEHPSVAPKDIRTTRCFRKLSSCAKTPKTQVIIAETLSEFRVYVQEVIERHQRYNLHSCRTLKRRFVSLGPMPLPTPYEETANIVIDGRMSGFINSLANDGDQQLKVLPVLGSACLGKTTLARVLYNRFRNQYHCRAFVRVSKKPDMKRIFCEILSQLQKQHPPQHYKEVDPIQNIRQYLQDKKYLIIIDDVWAASVWDIINQAFPKGNHGSRIITTTQIEDVALTCCCFQSENVFEMKHLDDDHSRKLFFNRLFGSQSDCPEQFKEVLNEIVDICDGLPLATIAVASLLASQPVMSIDLLKYIQQSLSSCLSISERTRQALNLSFNILPSYLKTCLLYLIMYPEGYTFCTDDLVKQWVAEGFIDRIEGQDMVKVAESYLDQLIARRFIQPICINYNNEVLSCAVHDTVYDLIAHKSAEENFVVAINYRQNSVACSHKARRLSLIFGDTRYSKTPANITKSQVRSLRFLGSLESMPCIGEFKLLRVLNLQLSGHPGINYLRHLTAISELSQLRYLKVACDVYIELPNHGLECLETLDITDANFVSWNIHPPNLLHLSLPLERLVDGIGLTKSLIRQRAGRLNCLQELHLTPDVYSLGGHMEALGFLIEGHGNLKTMAVARGSSVFKSIGVPVASEVTISWDSLAPPRHLERFEFLPHSSILFSRIPMWVKELDNLRILKIAVREIYCLETLRGLPALTALSLYLPTAPRHMIIFDTAAEFSVLKYFKLRCTSGIAWLKFEADAMPNLWKLRLVFNAIQPMDQRLRYSWNQSIFKQHQRGTAAISIKHMPGLKEISVKVGCAAADREYALRSFSNHRSNPTINMQLVDPTFYGDESTEEQKQPEKFLEEEPSGSKKQQPEQILQEEPNSYDKLFSYGNESTKRKQEPGEILEEELTRSNKQQPEENPEKEPDNYDKIFRDANERTKQKQQPDEILAEEPSRTNKQQPEEILEEEPDTCDTLSSYRNESEKQKQQPDEIVEEEPTGSNKQQRGEILEKELDNNDKLFSHGNESTKQNLMRSYDGLPYYLKSCFLYMPIFPKNYRVGRGRLVRRWTAECYSREVRGKSGEEIADGYFLELISRSMILPSQRSIYSTKGVDSCQVHDLMRDIAISKSIEENLVFTLEEGCSSNIQSIVRHLAINGNWKGDRSEFESIVDMSCVRSITVFGEWKSFFISAKMSLLRVLDLEDTVGLYDRHLKHIGKLLHLRYLSVRGCDEIHHLPDSLGNLRELQTLDVRGTGVIKLPKSIINLQKLCNLRAGLKPGDEDFSYEGYDEEGVLSYRACLLPFSFICFCFICCAPKFMSRDDNFSRRDGCTMICCSLIPAILMRLDNHGVLVPRGMRKLKALRTLGVVNIARCGKSIQREIRGLTGLHKLAVTGVSKENGEELCSSIVGLSHLESLSIGSEGNPGLSGCLDGKFSFPENLQKLKLYGYLVKLPEWIQGLNNLMKLELRSSRISEPNAAMQVLGNLPNLASLHMLRYSLDCEEAHLGFGPEMFQSLVVLELGYLSGLKSVTFGGGATPKLQLLKIYLPGVNSSSLLGLASLSGLKEVVLILTSSRGLEYVRGELALHPNRPFVKRG